MRNILLALLLFSSPSFGLVVTEMMYNPPDVEENLEFIELYNEKASPEDLSGYKFTQGIHYVFTNELQGNGRPVASLGSGEYLVLAKDAAAFESHYGFAPFGQYEGDLKNSGDKILLENDSGDPYDPVTNTQNRHQGAPVILFTYSDSGKWPVACDGTGHTLCLVDPFGSQKDPENWVASPKLWGTPGASNGLEDEWTEETFFDAGTSWKYIKGDSEPQASWKDRVFDDSSWSSGPTPIGYGEGIIVTELSDMGGNYRSFYARKSFNVSDPGEIDNLVLYVNYDDGFVAYLNGTEVSRSNVTGDPPSHDTLADSAGEPAGLAPYDISAFKDNLVAGTNVIAIQTHNGSDTSSDALMDAKLVSRSLILSGQSSSYLIINEAYFKNTVGNRFVEIYNRSSSPINLKDYYISSDPNNLDAHSLSGTIAAHGFVAVEEDVSFPLDLEYQDPPPEPPGIDYGKLRVFLSYIKGGDTEKAFVVAAENFSGHMENNWSVERIPDGRGKWFFSTVLTEGEVNQLGPNDVNTDIVINEIMYHPFRENNPYTMDDDSLYGRDLEYIELYNRGSSTVDLSGYRFSRGVDFVFPAGIDMKPGDYLVIASNPTRIKEIYSLSDDVVIGPYHGGLADDGEKIRLRDNNNNIVDEVRYYDAGHWDKWADGLGSSLELINPDQDNEFPGAWKASDDSNKSEWTTVSYHGDHNEVRNGESEFHMYLMGKGEVLLDDLELSTSSSFSNNLIKGGGDFNTSGDYTNYWSSGGEAGNHIDTHWTNEDSFSGAGCLKIVASGRGDSAFNRLESDTSSGLSSRTYYVRYKARWLRGFNLIMTRTQGHNVARSSPIQVPENLGTPGRRNSVYKANMGPVYSLLNQDPVVPNGGEPVKVNVEIRDSDGVAGAVIKYRDDTAGSYSQAVMNDSGSNGDKEAGDNIWTGTIPGQSDGVIVEFYIEAYDTAANTTQYPPLPAADAPATVLKDLAIYRVGDRQPLGRRPVYRITVTHDGENAFNNRRNMSNQLVPCSFVLNEKKIFYNCGQRFHGSPFIRRGGVGGYAWNGIRVRFPADDMLFGDIDEFNLDASGQTNQHDRTSYYLQRKLVAATKGVYNSWSWGRYVDVRYRAGGTNHTGIYDHLQKIDGAYVKYWFQGKDNGYLHKVDDWFEFSDNGNFSNWQASMAYHGENKEFYYRQNFKLRSHEKDDDFSHLINLCNALTNWSEEKIDSDINSIMNIDQWSTMLCTRLFIDDWDTLGARRGKNSYLYYPSPVPVPENPDDPNSPMVLSQEQWNLIPWDSDLAFGSQSAQIYPEGAFPELQKLYARPWVRRIINRNYRYLISNIVQSPGLSAWVNWVASSVGIGGTELPGWLAGRATNVFGRLPADSSYPFEITSPRGSPYVSNDPVITIEGQAPSNIDIITINDEDITDLVTWSGNNGTNWEYGPVTLADGLNTFTFGGYKRNGELVAETILRVLFTTEDPPHITSVWPAEGISIGGETITIKGSNLQKGLTVKFGDTVIEETNVTRIDDTEVHVVSPPHPAGDVALSIINPDDLPAFYEYFTYIPIPAPSVSKILPALGYTSGGSLVQIRGNYFQEGVEVYFGSTKADTVTIYGLKEIDAVAPAHSAGTVDIRIKNVDLQEVTYAAGFKYVTVEAPLLSQGITPPEGPTAGGNQVTINGSNFQVGALVWFGPNPVVATLVSADEITCTVPESNLGDTFVSIRVENPDGQFAWLPSDYRYVNGVKSCNRGDANGDGIMDLADGVVVLEQLFQGRQDVLCKKAADANGDGQLDIADAICILAGLFRR